MSRLLEALRTLEDRKSVEVEVDDGPVVDGGEEVDLPSASAVDDPPHISEEEPVLAEEPLSGLSLDALEDRVPVADNFDPPPTEEERTATADEDPDRHLPCEIPVSLDPSAAGEVEQLPSSSRSVVQEVSHVEQMCGDEFDALNILPSPSDAPPFIDDEDEVPATIDASEGDVEIEELVAPVAAAEESRPSTAPERDRIEIPLEWTDHQPKLSESAAAMLSLLPTSTAIPTWMMIGVDNAQRRLPWIIALATACSRQLEGALLLVDGDLAGRQLSRRLHVDDQPGLAEVLSGNLSIDLPLIPTSFEKLWFLPTGIGAFSKEDLSNAVAAMIEKTGDRFAGVMIDGGTSLSLSQRRTSRPWHPAILCEDLFLDVRLGESTESQIQQVVDSISASGITPRGCIAV